MVKIGTLYGYVIYEKVVNSIPYLFINEKILGIYSLAIGNTLKHEQINVYTNRTSYEVSIYPYKSLTEYLADYNKLRQLIKDASYVD